MGYDNECIVNISSLAGEYFCPVCRTLILPSEALQSQCTHLYCKPCLAYVVATTRACPYDGYLVTEADSKPLVESNKELAETIGKVAVHCLYHRSGCQWQGTLTESTAHNSGCNFGNSPVVCNRCGTQIIHRQVQEHAQICPGVQPQAQAAENPQAQGAATTNQAAVQAASSAVPATTSAATGTTAATSAVAATAASVTAASASAAAAAAPATAAAPGQTQVGAVVYPQATAQAPTAEQWYQQQQLQYQQYYQQYPGYDVYQQQYQQYAQYQQQMYPQYVQPQMHAAPQHVIPGQQQPQQYMHQPQPHLQQPQPTQAQAQAQVHPHAQPMPQQQLQPQALPGQPQLQQQQLPHSQTQPQSHPQQQSQPQPLAPAQVPQMQMQPPPSHQPHVHAQPQAQPPQHAQAAGQPYPQSQAHAAQARPQLPGPPQHQYPVPSQQLQQQTPHPQGYPQQQMRPQLPAATHPHPHSQPPPQQPPIQMQSQPQTHAQQNPQIQPSQLSAHAVSGYQSYVQPVPGAQQQRPMQMQPQQGLPPQHPPQVQAQFPPQQPPQMRPPHSQVTVPVQQQPGMPPHQGFHPTQQQVQHPMHQPGQQVHPQPGMQPNAQPGYPQPQGPLHPGQLPQLASGPQYQNHPQQPLRPQGPGQMQQSTPGYPHPQVNAPPPHGFPPNQAQARPMMTSQGIPQQPIPQSPSAGSRPMQPGVNQQSPSQNYTGRTKSTSSGQQTGPTQELQLPQSSSQTAPAAPKHEAGLVSVPDDAEGTKSVGRLSEHAYDSKGDQAKDVGEVKEEDGQSEIGNRDVPETLATEECIDGQNGPSAKQLKVEEGANVSGEATEGRRKSDGEKAIPGKDGKHGEISGAMFKGEDRSMAEGQSQHGHDKSVRRDSLRSNIERTNQAYVSDGHGSVGIGNSMHPPQHTQASAQGRGYPQPGHYDRNSSQLLQQYPVSDDRQGMLPGAPHGHPLHMADQAMISQRPPAPDRLFPPPVHQSGQERRFPEPSPHQMHVQAQAILPNQMRPPGHNMQEAFPHPGQAAAQEPFWPPPRSGVPSSSLQPQSGGISSRHGMPPKGFEQQVMAPPGQVNLPPFHGSGARTGSGDPLSHHGIGVPPPGALDTPGRMKGGPLFIPEDKMGKALNVNAMETEMHAIKRPGYDGRLLEPHRPLAAERGPYGLPNTMNVNGMSNSGHPAGMHDPTFARGLPEDRFRHLPEERFRPFPEEGFKSARDEHFGPALDPGRHVNRREFEEDLKQFPRPAHLDGDGPSRFDGYMSSSRPLDKMGQPPVGPNLFTSRPLSSYQPGAPFPPGLRGSESHPDIGDRGPIASHDHPGRRHDGTFVPPDRVNLAPEFGRHRADGLPPLRSPGHFGREMTDAMPGQLRRGIDGLGPLSHDFSGSNIRGNEMIGGSQSIPSFFRGGGFSGHRNPFDVGESAGHGNIPPHFRSDPGFTGRFSATSRDADANSFDQSRKRKAGASVKCLICKIDCDTVEGLELHSQGREHQKIAMDMVLSIKKENAKKHRVSESTMPFEDASKSRKAGFEKRGNRQ